MMVDDYAHHPTEVLPPYRQPEMDGNAELLLFFNPIYIPEPRHFIKSLPHHLWIVTF